MVRIQLAFLLVGMILLILFLSSLKMRLQYRRQGSNDYFSLELSLWRGFISYKLEVPVVKTELKSGFKPFRWPFWQRILRPAFKIEAKVTGENETKIKKEKVLGLSRILSIINRTKLFLEHNMPAIRYFLGKVYLQRFLWMTEFGLEEPHVTGFLVGLAGGLKGLLLSKLYRIIHPGAARPTVVITPQFKKPCFATQIDCEFDVKIGHIFLTGLKFVFIRLKG